MNLIMMGPPGAGKGTQAERFARRRGVPKISTGDILREAVHDGTELGRQAQAIMDKGDLVSDEVMIGIVRERLTRADAINGFVLDGFPRTVAQARALDVLVAERGPLIVVDVVVPENELTRRLRGRRICNNCGHNAGGFEIENAGDTGTDGAEYTCRLCGGLLITRTDDDEDVLVERLRVYARDTKPLVDFYRTRPTFRTLNGMQPPDRVAADLAAVVDSALAAMATTARGRPAERSL